ncbi:MAG: insulinase family protein [Candidatus Micrarchaeaceae archaeon]
MQKQKTSSVDSITLENGLTIYAAKISGFTGAAMAAAVNLGSNDEDKRGSAHLLEHAVLDSITEAEGKKMGYLAAYTRSDYTVYRETMYIDRMNEGVDIIGKLLLRPDLDKSTYVRAKKDVVQEVSKGAVKGFYSLTYMPFALYGIKSTGIDTEEEINGVSSTDFETLREMYKRYYTPRNISIGVVSGADTKEVFKLFREKLGSFEKKYQETERKPPLYAPSDIHVHLGSEMSEKEAVIVGYGCKSYSSTNIKENLAMYLIGDILKQRVLASLSTNADAINIQPSLILSESFGIISAYAEVKKGSEKNSIESIVKMFEDISHNGVTQHEIDSARDSVMQRFSPNEGNVEKTALDKAIGMSTTPLLYEHASDVYSISAEDIKGYARLFKEERYGTVTIDGIS